MSDTVGRKPRHHRQNRSATTARIQASGGNPTATRRANRREGGGTTRRNQGTVKKPVDESQTSTTTSTAKARRAKKTKKTTGDDEELELEPVNTNSDNKGTAKKSKKDKKLPPPPTPPRKGKGKGKKSSIASDASGAVPDFAYKPQQRHHYDDDDSDEDTKKNNRASVFLTKFFLYDEEMEEGMVSSYELLDNDVFFTPYESGQPVVAGRSDDPEFMSMFGAFGGKKNMTKEEKKEARRTLKNLQAKEMAAIAAAAAQGLDEEGVEEAKRKFKVKNIGVKKPYFIYAICVIDILLFAYTIFLNGGFEPLSVNPMLGPSGKVLVDMGAKYNPAIRAGEFWRFATPMFLHVGVFHIVMNLLFTWAVGKDLELFYGPWPIVKIYIVAGVGGNIVSSIFLPHQISVGASSSLYGFYGVKIIDLIQNWTRIKHPVRATLDLAFNIILSLITGLVPQIDNFAHLGGMLTGMIAAVVWLPKLGKRSGLTGHMKRMIALIAFLGLIVWLALLLLIFYTMGDGTWCDFCVYLNCINFPGLQWCSYSENFF
eukprot:TRINITY_DN1403_c0_g2_i1.p1 TRINITY_DN1403_c0_g2~~TRINITY_DN1403_c0_g2_i1.p1  ORF type:complete len:541 (+),score=173.30 TRINITY_DN1403_c0_g2_i1:63-1685(+)